MGRKKHENPSRAEKEKIRKLREPLFKRAKMTAMEHGVDVYVLVRHYDAFYTFTSSKAKDWPPTKEMLVELLHNPHATATDQMIEKHTGAQSLRSKTWNACDRNFGIVVQELFD